MSKVNKEFMLLVVLYSEQTGVLKPHENIPMAKPLLSEEVDLVSRASCIFPVSGGPRDYIEIDPVMLWAEQERG